MFTKALVALTAASVAWFPFVSGQSIVDIAVGDDRFETLVAAVTAAGLAETLSGDGTFTVFAPTDDAFMNVNVTKLLEDEWKGHLQSVLLYHVLGSEVFSSDLQLDLTAETLEGSSVTVTSLNPPQINNAEIIIADLDADNGVIHVIDDVLLPPSMTESIVDLAVATPTLSTLVDLVLAAGLEGALSGDGPFTVFAPSNDAFSKLPQATVDALLADPTGALTDVLLYHVVPGIILSSDLTDGATAATLQGASVDVSLNPAMINNANIALADVLASNGVVHVIDTVLIPPPTPAPMPEPEPVPEQLPAETIVDIASSDPDTFSTLVDLVVLADLAETLAGDGPFTVFAPTNAAFAKLPQATVDALVADKAALTEVLLYHVVSGTVLSTDLSDGASAITLQGATVDVTIDSSGVMINNANVIAADVLASNGVIHVIDTVLIPPVTLPADGYSRLISDDYTGSGNACMEVKDGVVTNGQRVILGDCTAVGGGWRMDDNHMIHSELNNDFCLQAGYGGRHNMVGRVLRIQRCRNNNRLQRWEFKDGEKMSPRLNDHLCVVWRGTTANVGKDPMILLDCDRVKNKENWSLHA